MTRFASASRLLLPLAVFTAGTILSLGVLAGALLYVAKYRLTIVSEYQSPSGATSVAFYMVGEPECPFGPAIV